MGCYEVSLGDTIGVGTPGLRHLLVLDRPQFNIYQIFKTRLGPE